MAKCEILVNNLSENHCSVKATTSVTILNSMIIREHSEGAGDSNPRCKYESADNSKTLLQMFVLPKGSDCRIF